MKRQTLFLLPVFLFALGFLAFFGYRSLRASRALATPGSWHPAAVLGLTLDVPADISAPALDSRPPWTAMNFRTAILGTLRIAREQPQGDLQGALRNWFGLSGPLDAPVTYLIRGQLAQARPVTVFGPSGLLFQRQGRQFAAVCVFDLDGSRYWIQARTGDANRATVACFHRVLRSIRGPGGAGVDPLLGAQLEAAEKGLDPRLVQGLPWFALIPLGMVALVLGITLALGRWSGKPPRGQEGPPSGYSEAHVEVLLALQLQRRYFDAALAVTGGRLVLYTFGRPFLTVPLDTLPGRVSEGSGWFGPPYLELALEGSQDFRKLGRWYGMWKSRTRLRIYTQDYRRLRAALGS